MSSLLFLVNNISQENTHPENMSNIVLKKGKRRVSTVNKTSDYVEAAVCKGSIKTVLC